MHGAVRKNLQQLGSHVGMVLPLMQMRSCMQNCKHELATFSVALRNLGFARLFRVGLSVFSYGSPRSYIPTLAGADPSSRTNSVSQEISQRPTNALMGTSNPQSISTILAILEVEHYDTFYKVVNHAKSQKSRTPGPALCGKKKKNPRSRHCDLVRSANLRA